MASQGGHFAGSVLCWLFLEKTYSRWGKAVPPIPAENQFQSAQTPPTTVLVKRGSTGEHVFSACRANKFDGEGPPQKRCYHLSSLACPGKVFLLHPRILTGPRHALDRVRRLDHLNPAPPSSQEHSLAVHEALRLRQCLDFFLCIFWKQVSEHSTIIWVWVYQHYSWPGIRFKSSFLSGSVWNICAIKTKQKLQEDVPSARPQEEERWAGCKGVQFLRIILQHLITLMVSLSSWLSAGLTHAS